MNDRIQAILDRQAAEMARQDAEVARARFGTTVHTAVGPLPLLVFERLTNAHPEIVPKLALPRRAR